MRVRLPALIALVSAASYVACGSNDPSTSVPQAGGGAAGEAGDGPSVAGSQNIAGSNNTAGSKNNVGGEGGVPGGGGRATAGAAGAEVGGESAGGTGALTGAGAGGVDGTMGGASGAGGEAPLGTVLPLGCVGALADYALVLGTAEDDSYAGGDLGGNKLVYGLEGDDSFGSSNDGHDCLVGGPGDDDFTNSSEQASYFVGGPGSDTYHINTTSNYVKLVDMESGDVIGLSKAQFPFLNSTVGEPPSSLLVSSVAGYSTGTASGVVEGAAIVYDPTTGELWQDPDGGAKASSAVQIGTILNHDVSDGGYVFDINDFILED
jgi:hypothetical protein